MIQMMIKYKTYYKQLRNIMFVNKMEYQCCKNLKKNVDFVQNVMH